MPRNIKDCQPPQGATPSTWQSAPTHAGGPWAHGFTFRPHLRHLSWAPLTSLSPRPPAHPFSPLCSSSRGVAMAAAACPCTPHLSFGPHWGSLSSRLYKCLGEVVSFLAATD